MKLNADIVYTWLCKTVSASIDGPRQTDLCLMRPEFLEPETERLRANHLYVCLPEHLPRRVDVEAGCVLVCAGESARLRHFEQRCCVICTHGNADLFHVFNCVQAIFNTFSAWEAGLHRTLVETGDIAELLEASVPIFDAQIQAIDANFHFLGVAWPQGAEVISSPSSEGDLTVDALRQFLQESDNAMMRTGVVAIDIDGVCTLNVNLLDGNRYRGCVTLMSRDSEFRPCDGPLLAYLAGFVLRAVNGLTLAGSGDSSIRTSLHDLVEGLPVSIKSQEELRAMSRSRTFVCATIALPRQLDTLSPRYICSQIEGSFSRCWAFEHHKNSLVAILEVPGPAPSGDLLGTISNALRPIIDLGGSSMGISNPLTTSSTSGCISARRRRPCTGAQPATPMRASTPSPTTAWTSSCPTRRASCPSIRSWDLVCRPSSSTTATPP